MSNFDFLKPEFKSFYPNASQVEKLALLRILGEVVFTPA